MERTFELPTLYKESKNGKIRKWTIGSNGDQIVTTYGQKGGKMRTTTKTAKAKNVGKSNETTPQEQAKKEAKSKWQKKLDKKYFKSIEEAKKIHLFPMLAKSYDEDKMSYPCDIQAKLDGMRCLAYKENGRIILKSRGGKEFENLDHIKDQLDVMFKAAPDVVFDGELYLHGVTFQEVTRRIKKYRSGKTEEISFYVYDCLYKEHADRKWDNRVDDLRQFMGLMMQTQNIKHVNSLRIENDLEMQAMHDKFIEEGYEGSIVRLLDYPYELGHRSSGLFKVKDFEDDEFKIIGYKEGEGVLKGCVVWECITDPDAEPIRKGDDKNTFEAIPKGNLKQRQQWLKEAEEHLGKWLKVKFFGKGETGLPRHPVGLGFRGEEDM